jgi:hypothetical protein
MNPFLLRTYAVALVSALIVWEAAGMAFGDTAGTGKRAETPQLAPPSPESAAIAQIKSLGGKVVLDENDPLRPVVSVDFTARRRVTDSALDCLTCLA